MDWRNVGPFIAVLAAIGTMWWQLNVSLGNLETRLGNRLERVDTTLVQLAQQVGRLEGASHTHNTLVGGQEIYEAVTPPEEIAK